MASPVRRTGVTILIADDDHVIRHVTESVLSRHGYSVITAQDGETALKQFQGASQAIQLVVSDLSMPGLRGPDLIAAVRKLSPSVAVLLMSGTYPVAATDDFPVLRKPFSMEVFVAKIEELLSSVNMEGIASEQSAARLRPGGCGRKGPARDCPRWEHC